jgi:hypothetical protein
MLRIFTARWRKREEHDRLGRAGARRGLEASSSLEPFFEKHESTKLNPKFRSG